MNTWSVTVHYRDDGEEYSETVEVQADDDIEAETAAVNQVCGEDQVLDVVAMKC